MKIECQTKTFEFFYRKNLILSIDGKELEVKPMANTPYFFVIELENKNRVDVLSFKGSLRVEIRDQYKNIFFSEISREEITQKEFKQLQDFIFLNLKPTQNGNCPYCQIGDYYNGLIGPNCNNKNCPTNQ